MSIRIRLAKWLAPEMERERQGMSVIADEWRSHAKRLANSHKKAAVEAGDYASALRNIIALKTPSCANVGRRMADIAEAALSQPNLPTREER